MRVFAKPTVRQKGFLNIRLTLFMIEPTFDCFFLGVGCVSGRRSSSFLGVAVADGEGEGDAVGDGLATLAFELTVVPRELPIRNAPPAIKIKTSSAMTSAIGLRPRAKSVRLSLNWTSMRLSSGRAGASTLAEATGVDSRG